MQKGRSPRVPSPSPPWWAPDASPYVQIGGSSSVFPGQQEGGAGLGRAEAAGDSQRSSPVSSGTSTLSAELTCCLPYRDQHISGM